jgi:hypothetical protein
VASAAHPIPAGSGEAAVGLEAAPTLAQVADPQAVEEGEEEYPRRHHRPARRHHRGFPSSCRLSDATWQHFW